MSELFLSICIATFRRGVFIGETLECLLAQVTDEVEVLVLDGGSPDNTAEIVQTLQEKYPCLRYVRQETNRGVDRDFDHAVELARGEYCWLMTDDDLVKPGTVTRIIEACRKGYELVVVNCDVWNIDFSERIEERRLAVYEDREYAIGEDERFFSETASYLQFIGGVVIRRSTWLTRDRKTYYGTLFVHVGVVFQEPLPGRIFVIADPMITVRFGNAMWTPRMFEIWNFKWPELVWSFPQFSEPAKRRVCEREPWKRLLVLLLDRAKGAYSLDLYRKWIAPRTRSPLRRLAAGLIAVFPPAILNPLGMFWLSTISTKFPLHLKDLQYSRYNRLGRWIGRAGGRSG